MFEFETVRSTFFERVEVNLCSLWDDSWCGLSGPKLVYRNCESVCSSRIGWCCHVCIRWVRMGSILLAFILVLSRDEEFETNLSRSNIGRISMALCSIGLIHGVVQVIQNCYMGIQNLSQISRLVWCCQVCIRWERMDLSVECFLLLFLGDVRFRRGSFNFFWEGRGDPM